MQKTEQFVKNAADCRVIASTVHADRSRRQLLVMAETWDSLARARIARFRQKAAEFFVRSRETESFAVKQLYQQLAQEFLDLADGAELVQQKWAEKKDSKPS